MRRASKGTLGTFGTGGKATANVAGKTDIGYGSALQADGKILIGGTATNGTITGLGLARVIEPLAIAPYHSKGHSSP